MSRLLAAVKEEPGLPAVRYAASAGFTTATAEEKLYRLQREGLVSSYEENGLMKWRESSRELTKSLISNLWTRQWAAETFHAG
jgi:hypothetical protein